MMETIFKAVVGITVFAGGWLTVQIAWRRVFSETVAEQDGAAIGCHGCGRTNCETNALEQKLTQPPQINRED